MLNLKVMPLNLNGELRAEVAVHDDDRLVHVGQFNVASDFGRSQFIKKVRGKMAGADADMLESRLLEAYAGLREEAERDSKPAEPEDWAAESAEILAKTDDSTKAEALDCLQAPNLMQRIFEDAAKLGVAGERRLSQVLYLVGTSRLLDRPLAAIVQGASSSGKSYVMNMISSLIPPEGIVQAHSITEMALYYMVSGSLEHRLIVSGEREREAGGDNAQLGSKAFREMIADGFLRKAVTVKDPEGGLTTRIVEQAGPIAYLESSTAGVMHEEDATRLLFLASDESSTQTEAIIETIQRDLAGVRPSPAEREHIRNVHRTAQRMLRTDVTVVVPWADVLRLPSSRVAARRAMGQLASALRAIAFLRQHQKTGGRSDTGCTIEADATDYAVALELFGPVLGRIYDPLDGVARETLMRLDEAFGAEMFTRDTASKALGISEGHATRRLKPLIARGLITQDREVRPYQHRRSSIQIEDSGDIGLPSVDEVRARCEGVSPAHSRPPAHSRRKPLPEQDLSVREQGARSAHAVQDDESAPSVRGSAHAQVADTSGVPSKVRREGEIPGGHLFCVKPDRDENGETAVERAARWQAEDEAERCAAARRANR